MPALSGPQAEELKVQFRGLDTLTQWVSFSILVWNCEHPHHSMALLAEVAVDFLSKEALTNKGQLQLVFEINL